MSGGIDETSMMLGGLKNAVENMTKQLADQQKAETDGRRVLHEKIDQLRRDQSDQRAKLEGVERTLTEIKPAVKNFENAQQQAEGMRKLGVALWFGIAAISGIVGYIANEALSMFRGASPPH